MLASLENHFLEFGELLTQVFSIKPVGIEPSVAVVKNRVQFVRNVFNAIVDGLFHLKSLLPESFVTLERPGQALLLFLRDLVVALLVLL